MVMIVWLQSETDMPDWKIVKRINLEALEIRRCVPQLGRQAK